MNRRTFIMGGIGAVGLLAAGGWSFTRRPEFGRLPQGERLARLQASPHYKNGQFQNLVPVQVMNEDSGESRLVTPEIGEAAYLDSDSAQNFGPWWEKMK